jgi:hypothetical protein
MARVLISGRRADQLYVVETLERFQEMYLGKHDFSRNVNGERHIIIEGGADGVDLQAAEWAIKKRLITINHPAEWDRWVRGVAGPFRNKEMLDLWRPNWLVAFLTPESKGTRNMLDQAIAMRDNLALNILLVKYIDESGKAAPIEVQESMYGLPTQKSEWGDWIGAPF